MFIDSVVLILVLFAVLAWGANRPLLTALFSAGMLLAFACKLIANIWKGHIWLRRSTLFLPLLAFFLLVCLQLLSPVVDLNVSTFFLPHTVEPHTTRTYLLLISGFIALSLSVSNGFHTRRQISLAVIGIIGLGAFESLYGLVQRIGGFEYVWTVPTRGVGAQGTLMNHNHFAFLLNIAICAGAGLLYHQTKKYLEGRKLSLREILSAPDSFKLFWILLWIGLIGLGVLLSLSRAGIFAMFAALGFMSICIGFVEKRKYAAFALALAILAVVSLGVYAGVDAALQRYANLAERWQLEASRIQLWKDALPLIGKAPLFGMGLGTFQWTYPAYESLNPDVPAVYAHNDYLQLLIETGIAGIALMLWAYVICWKSAMRNLVAGDILARSSGLASAGALIVAAIQEITDYSLYIPGVAATLILLLCLNERIGRLQTETAGKTSITRSGTDS